MDFNTLLPNEVFSERVFYLVIAFSSISVFIMVVILLCLVQYKKQEKKDAEEEEIKNKAYSDAMKIMDAARLRSLKIMEESHLKAQRSLDSASNISQAAKAELDKKTQAIYEKQATIMEELGQDFVKTYKEALDKERKENMQVIDETSNMLKKELTSEIQEIKETVRKGTIEKQEEIEKKLVEEYQKIEEEMKDYKAKKIKEIDERIFDIIARVSDTVLGRMIDQSSHEKFILDTLREELQKQGLVVKG